MRFPLKYLFPPGTAILSEPSRRHRYYQRNVQFARRIGGVARRAAFAAVVAVTSILASAQTTPQSKSGSANPKVGQREDSRVARGKYIVEGIARCGQCHTPRDVSGSPDRNHTLEGAPVWLKSAAPTEDWPLQAPRLAGTPPGTDAEMITLLTTGIWKDGRRLRDPMPQFRMTTEDAEAVVAYLKSLNPAAKSSHQ